MGKNSRQLKGITTAIANLQHQLVENQEREQQGRREADLRHMFTILNQEFKKEVKNLIMLKILYYIVPHCEGISLFIR